MPCSDLTAKGYNKADIVPKNSGYFDAVFDNFLLCVDKDPKEPLTVVGQGADLVFTMAQTIIFPCSLESGCVPSEDLGGLGFMFSRSQKSIELNKLSQPVTALISGDDYLTVDISRVQYYTDKLMQIKIIDSKGFMFPVTEKSTFTKIGESFLSSKSRTGSTTTCTR